MTDARTALITGGNRGIGLATALRLQEAGYRVVVGSRSGQAPEGLDVVTLDVSDTDSVNDGFTAAEELLGSPIEILVANAGITRDMLLMRMKDEDINDVLDTNLVGAIRCARRAAKGMLRLKKGRIVFISSIVGTKGSPGQVNYAASKAGLIGASRSLARELGPRSITSNVIMPGFIATDMTDELPEDLKESYRKEIPLGRMGEATEVANAVEFLVSPGASYVNGVVLPVDGGFAMGS
ncbi:3-oxoacyl-ACP reductase FabG [Dermatophilus congolensis]|uniref:3-oxoacyl-[acyl-carrier-protein] reductase FabG1 n=1 Tax=Dermatophilus congolensis TaxID=1863 RepID=A0AA46BN62_9MICO|nr:3-oxoacyl-ACP reductase FabG [Dermatophilus congolensis]MBO3142877.1 SDR family oxidoreductase [Dermatophilus congolensis]MBO3151868.1 SDR family oxidoreductase [Dermatophilus congolensis]MBO3161127.1 SDR family oxidoreductase [Dermatophilus congolensis]MBO3163151.1 SDR family oxidoreductase [Dermatophilus congolensis]MBO3176706.1 SDR family oxidoreductase [Dermatophilus congolensis]